EAVIFFDPHRAAGMPERRKRGGHLISKHRFLAAQIEAYLADDLWLALARDANAMADRLAAGLAAANLVPVWPGEANEGFVALPPQGGAPPKAAGGIYYPWTVNDGSGSAHEGTLVRLVTSFATTLEEIERFLAIVRASC